LFVSHLDNLQVTVLALDKIGQPSHLGVIVGDQRLRGGELLEHIIEGASDNLVDRL
jgi:hypothetical protein